MLGTAVGDSIGLPAEGMSRQRIKRFYHGEWRQRLVLKWGMVSDDTEHTIFVAQSLLAYSHSPPLFVKRLAWCLRFWLLALPAGTGWATLRAIFKLWIGISPLKSGVYSAGNGPAMRAAPIGAFFASEPEQLENFIRLSTQLTHKDPRAFIGAYTIAVLSAWIIREDPQKRPCPEELLTLLAVSGADEEWLAVVDTLSAAIRQDLTVADYAASLGLSEGVSGYIYHTVPMVIYAWYQHFGDFEKTIKAVLDCGGDTDSTAAIAGALAGAVGGEKSIPEAWLSGIRDWPRGKKVLQRIADRLAEKNPEQTQRMVVHYFWPGVVVRNLFFLIIVLFHGFRRLGPPY
ncbi:ADP-ribosylglycohydrolase family protein [candidate division CSSED10-310 bacterium]|uniref:ADP-ribosylglycohydrolase family protein n=1 Tax=candidate division CSSED10-310 bacterium TaxID=2855610 RepID=A0ABV6YS27_UNCC1